MKNARRLTHGTSWKPQAVELPELWGSQAQVYAELADSAPGGTGTSPPGHGATPLGNNFLKWEAWGQHSRNEVQ
jgi:hypothetical protein